MTDPCFLDATDAARMIAARELSPVELARAALDRIDSVQPVVNAFTFVDRAAVLAAAEAAEAAVMRGGETGPLHGVPFTVKDMIAVAGHPITYASHAYRDNVPERDAVAVERLKAAGGIVLAITTMPELGPKATTDSRLWGVTRNPWDPSRTPGGSSGGGAAAVASGCGAITLGTDRAGSVRIPASCCALVGLKPTPGRVANADSASLFDPFSVIGPLTRSVADCALAMSILGGPHPGDPRSGPMAAGPASFSAAATGDLDGVRIGWTGDVGNGPAARAVEAACREALAALRARGAEIREIDIDLSASLDLMRPLATTHLRAVHGAAVAGLEDEVDPVITTLMGAGAAVSGTEVAEAWIGCTRLYRRIEAELADLDAIATPTLSTPALPLDPPPETVLVDGRDAGPTRQGWFPYCHPFNHSGHPAISVPCGWDPQGLPIGIQFAARWWDEAMLLRLAAELEAARPWSDRRPALAAAA